MASSVHEACLAAQRSTVSVIEAISLRLLIAESFATPSTGHADRLPTAAPSVLLAYYERVFKDVHIES
jgi:hypothetical protein